MQYIAVIYLFFVSVRVYIMADELGNPPPLRACVLLSCACVCVRVFLSRMRALVFTRVFLSCACAFLYAIKNHLGAGNCK